MRWNRPTSCPCPSGRTSVGAATGPKPHRPATERRAAGNRCRAPLTGVCPGSYHSRAARRVRITAIHPAARGRVARAKEEMVHIETSEAKAAPERDLTPEELVDAVEASLRDFKDGDIVEGTVVKIDRDEVLLVIGYKSEGVIPAKELSIRHDIDPNEVVHVGDRIEALVLQKEDKEGRLILSKKRAQYERAWGRIEEVMQSGGTIKGPVIEVVKGGLIVDIGLRGFLPASLVDLRRVRDLHPYVGQEIEAKIIELDRNRNNVVLSRRAFLEESQSEGRKKFLESLQKGERRKGTVSSIVNFGAFVDLGGVDGLIHVSELSWKHVDLERERVSLSLKATQEDPWKEFERKYRAGEVISGQVTKIVPFGAFVRVAQGIEGLVHISELSTMHVESPEQIVNVGDQVRVKVIDVDVPRRRISLSMRQVGDEVAVELEPEIVSETVSTEELVEDIVPEPSVEAEEILADAEARADEAAPEVLETTVEPEPAAPEEAAMHAEQGVSESPPEEEEEVSLEAILRDLKRREGRE